MTYMRILPFVLAFGLSSCSFFGESDDDRTLPHAADFDLVTINEFNQSVPLPGSYNVRGYVVSTRKCPDRALCILADGIVVYTFDDADPNDDELRKDGLFIATDVSEEFTIGDHYEFSVSADYERVPEAAWPITVIVGYDVLPL